MSVFKISINIENLKCQVNAAAELQACGEDHAAKEVLFKMARSILEESGSKK